MKKITTVASELNRAKYDLSRNADISGEWARDVAQKCETAGELAFAAALFKYADARDELSQVFKNARISQIRRRAIKSLSIESDDVSEPTATKLRRLSIGDALPVSTKADYLLAANVARQLAFRSGRTLAFQSRALDDGAFEIRRIA